MIHASASRRPAVRLLALCGSLRAVSSNLALLQAAGRLAPPNVAVDLFAGLDSLPHFNPDVEEAADRAGGTPLPGPVADLRARAGAADGLLICCPEYAGGVPGGFKNLLDWLVGCPALAGKPVALWNASPRATAAQAALALILTTMSARLLPAASLTLPVSGRGRHPEEIVADPALALPVGAALLAFARALGTGEQQAG